MAGYFRVYVDVAGRDGLPHVYIGITDSSGTERYSGYGGPVRTAPFGVPGRVSHGLEPQNLGDAKNVAGYMERMAWASPARAISDEQIAAMNAKIQEWEDNPGTYTIFANHCATMVSVVLDAGGIDYPKSGVTNHLGLLASGLMIVVAVQMKNPVLAMLSLGVSGFFNDLSMPGAWGACMDIGGNLAGSVSGSMNMIGNLGGALGGVAVPWLMKSMGFGWHGVLYVAAATYLVSALCWLFINSDDRLHD